MQIQQNNFIFPKNLYIWLIITLSIVFLLYRFLIEILPVAAHNSFIAFNHWESHFSYWSYIFFYSYLITQCVFAGILVDRFGVGLFTSFAIICSAFGYIYEAPPVLFNFLNYTWQASLIFIATAGFVLTAISALIVRDYPKLLQPFSFVEIKSVLKNPQNFMLMLYSGLAFAPITAFCGFWGKPFLEEAYHFNSRQVMYLAATLLMGMACGGPIIEFYSDRIQRRRIFMLLGILIQELTFIAIVYLHGMSFWTSAALMSIFGFASGAFMLSFVIGKQTNNLTVTATLGALINIGIALIAVFTESLLGKFLYIDWDGNLINGVRHFSIFDYHLAFMILPVYLLIAFVLLLFIKEAAELN